MKTVLHHYCFDISKPAEKAAYVDLLENTLKKVGFPFWFMNLDGGYTATSAAWDFMDKVRKAAGAVELETTHLFDNQWNSAPIPGVGESGLRLFNLAECKYHNRYVKEGYWLEQTPEMREILRNTHKCGYCGAQEPAQKGYTFCPHCIGSEYLTEETLHLTRMVPVRDSNKKRAELTAAERANLLPVYKEAQLYGNTVRDKARLKKQRADIQKEFDSVTKRAQIERDGLTALLDLGLKIDNVIYYAHTNRFSFGWRSPVSPAVLSGILDVISEFPYPYEIKCADGRKLEGN